MFMREYTNTFKRIIRLETIPLVSNKAEIAVRCEQFEYFTIHNILFSLFFRVENIREILNISRTGVR